MVSIEGTVLSIIFRNEENGYTVLEIDFNGEITACVGNMQTLIPGEYVIFYGAWTTHKNFGKQFKVSGVKSSLPKSLDSIELYLSSGLISGIGEVLSSRIVEKFGYSTFDIMQHEPERLSEVRGVSLSLAKKIGSQFENQVAVQSIVMDLQDMGLTVKQAVSAYETYGSAAAELISKNPYRLIDEIYGFGFERADRIAQNIGLNIDSPYRIDNGIKHVLKLALKQGNTCLPQTILKKRAELVLKVDSVKISERLDILTYNGDIIRKDFGFRTAVFLYSAYYCEHECSSMLFDLHNTDPSIKIKDSEEQLAKYSGKYILSEEQEDAVLSALKNKLSVITGGPGTGKTTIINAILKIFERTGITCALCAPTGRAAKRMESATGHEAKTIHRLLEYGICSIDDDEYTHLPDFARNENNPLEAEAVIVDETSMVDIFLLRSLLKALSPGTRLILVGDADQLPSVGPGNVLRDIIDSNLFCISRLTHFYRQSGGGNIVANAHKVNAGEYPELFETGDFIFIKKDDPEDLIGKLENLISELSKEYDILSQLQVLCPMRKGICGVFNLNSKLREVLNPQPQIEVALNGTLFSVNDKIMQIKNNYSTEWTNINDYSVKGTGVFNGDIGKITSIDPASQELSIVFENERLCVYDYKMAEQIEHAYATTVHKAQGSEFDVIILPLLFGLSPFLTRNLLYTALTRAKKKVYLIGTENTVRHMVDNDKINLRYTILKRELIDLGEILSIGQLTAEN